MRYLRLLSIALLFPPFTATTSNAQVPAILEKKVPFPSPVQWKSGGGAEISLIALAWGPANSPEMISKGHEYQTAEKPQFFADRSYALALEFRAKLPGLIATDMFAPSGLVRIKNVEGDLEGPWQLTSTGFMPFLDDLHFQKSDTAEFWDFFPASPSQREFLFQAGPYSAIPSAGNPKLSFRIILKDNDLVIVNASPEAQTVCPGFAENLAGKVGPTSEVNLQLTRNGATLSGTEQYVRVGTTLWLRGQVDSFGNFVLEERYPEDRVTGLFKGSFSGGCRTMTGYFSKPDGSRLQPFEFHEVGATSGKRVRDGS